MPSSLINSTRASTPFSSEIFFLEGNQGVFDKPNQFLKLTGEVVFSDKKKFCVMSFAPKIRVNGIAPGPTIKNKRQSVAHFKKQYLATPLRRQVNVNDICNAVDFLIKNRSITGQVLALDSGQSLNWQTPDVLGGKE